MLYGARYRRLLPDVYAPALPDDLVDRRAESQVIIQRVRAELARRSVIAVSAS